MGGERAVAIVLRCGFATAKGRLVRSIIYPKPSNLEFYSDSFKFVVCIHVCIRVNIYICI